MFELSTLILTAIVALVAGGAIGALLFKSLAPQEQQNRELESRLQKAENKLTDYQQEVSEHFAETSQLVNNLTQSYKEVHEYLANSALKLTNPDISRQLIDAGDGKLIANDTNVAAEESTPEAPRDWAPKAPGEKGQLSEDFGLEPNHQEEEKITP
ncbi:YhcB family protein [Pseudomaricurvus alkylphenolicus]|uniref:ZapG family protein n=1 Tax=Pseudomaricurvus alkylphenolicus TaxID=1306991 RepID=UPI00142068FF|nr:YhcB family protein [Pseudomaricurvus alkylphenolicus]